jgi:hypothetical protein
MKKKEGLLRMSMAILCLFSSGVQGIHLKAIDKADV